jgi:hypothetical protein
MTLFASPRTFRNFVCSLQSGLKHTQTYNYTIEITFDQHIGLHTRHTTACVSPRTFWNVVRLCGVGPNKTFDQALRQILPNADWDVLLSRTQQEKEEGFYRVAAGGRASAGRAKKSPQKGKKPGKKEGDAVEASAERGELDSDSEEKKEQNEEEGKDANIDLVDDDDHVAVSSAKSRRQDDEEQEDAEQATGEEGLNVGVAPVKAESAHV